LFWTYLINSFLVELTSLITRLAVVLPCKEWTPDKECGCPAPHPVSLLKVTGSCPNIRGNVNKGKEDTEEEKLPQKFVFYPQAVEYCPQTIEACP
jgi:hypothetical protein